MAPVATRRQVVCIPAFGDIIGDLDASFRRLLACDPITFDARPRQLPTAVVYLFSERSRPFYVGRSNKFNKRLGQHCNHGSQTNQASLAFRLACDEIQHVRIKYKKGSSSAEALRNVPGLAEAFARTKLRMRSMEIRYVEEIDQVRQGMLEMYVALALGTKHDFGTH